MDNRTDITAGENVPHVLISQADCLSRTRAGGENTVKGVCVEIGVLDKDRKVDLQLHSLY